MVTFLSLSLSLSPSPIDRRDRKMKLLYTTREKPVLRSTGVYRRLVQPKGEGTGVYRSLVIGKGRRGVVMTTGTFFFNMMRA
jgi:hypothetical protein